MDIIDLSTIPEIPVAIAGIWGALADFVGSSLSGIFGDEDEDDTGAALVSAGGSLLGGIMGRNAQKDAADARAQAQRLSIEEQRRQFDETMELNRPIHESNLRARQAQEDLLGLGGMGGGGQSGQSQTPEPTIPGTQDAPPVMRGGDSPSFGRNSPLDRNRQFRHREGLINALAANPENRRQFVRNNANQIPEDNPNRRNILRRVGG